MSLLVQKPRVRQPGELRFRSSPAPARRSSSGFYGRNVDFDLNVIRIRRMQERDGSLTNFTKTSAGTRDIPMCSLLRAMLLDWREVCPRLDGELHRVFPGRGQMQPWPLPRTGGGGPLLSFPKIISACISRW